MKNIKYIYLLIVTCFTLTACEDYLDTTPFGVVTPTETSDYRLLLDQVDDVGRSTGVIRSYSNDEFLSDNMAVQLEAFGLPALDVNALNAYTFSEHIYLDNEEDPDWSSLYNQVYLSNVVISQVMESTGGTEDEKQMLQNEARTHRAYAYLKLVNLYAKHYNASTASVDLGVPLRLRIDFEEALPRASVQDVYDLILEDLSLAVQNLPLSPESNINYRPNVAGAYGLLARTSLYMNNIDDALMYADLSLSNNGALIDYNTLPLSSLFPPFFNVLDLPDNLFNEEISLFKSNTGGFSTFAYDNALSALLSPDDVRVRATSVLFGPFRLSLEFTNNTPNKGISTAEMYLIKAECHARKGELTAALDAINVLRENRFETGSSFQLTATTAAEALVLIKEERRRELAFKGQRLFDIKRYNLFDNDNISITHTLPDTGETFMLEPGNPRFVLPIGRKYIGLNPEIEQNPR